MSIVSSGQLGNIQSKTNAQASINFKSQNTSVFSEQIYETIDYVTDVLEDFADVAGTALATGAVVATTIISGVAKVVEYVADGVIWLGGTVISWVQDLFGYDTAAEKMRQSTMNTIARDVVGEMNKDFYENSILGRAINSKSLMKYDSELAKTIQNITVKAVELTAAIALTVATGGLCAPLAAAAVIGVGSLEGIGKSAEDRYKDIDPEKRQYQTGAILLDGFANGLNWYATGKIGSAGIKVATSISHMGCRTFTKTFSILGKRLLNNISIKDIFSKKFFLKTIQSGFFDGDNLVDSLGIVADNYADWFNGGELDLNKIMKELAIAYGLNCAFNGFANLLEPQNMSDVIAAINKNVISKNPNLEFRGVNIHVFGSVNRSGTKAIEVLEIFDKNTNITFNIQKEFIGNYEFDKTIDVINDMYKNHPEMNGSLHTINITDIDCPDDPYWAQIHNDPDFVSVATGGDGTINFYKPTTDGDLIDTTYHEAAHCLDGGHVFSDSQAWSDAVAMDGVWASNYARSAYHCRTTGRFAEDFADSIANLKTMGANDFELTFPNRANFLKSLVPSMFV